MLVLVELSISSVLSSGLIFPLATLMSLINFANSSGRSFTQSISRQEQKDAGQFMTPALIAQFMASRLVDGFTGDKAVILEPSAGGGVLVAAVIESLLALREKPSEIHVVAWEQDSRLLGGLNALMERAKNECLVLNVKLTFVVECGDFLLSELAVSGQEIENLLVIANPPFLKLRADDKRAEAHPYAVFGQPNIYGLFMAATARLVGSGGKWCFISPRSWMGGPYFSGVRKSIFEHLTLNAIHAFESRKKGFEEDSVLQESSIVWFSHGPQCAEDDVWVSKSDGVDDLGLSIGKVLDFSSVVNRLDSFSVRIPVVQDDLLDSWSQTLSSIGFSVSAGPVVPFRALEQVRGDADETTVPLLWLQHVQQQKISWPIQKKKEHIVLDEKSKAILVKNRTMVVARRFSPKEDPRRLTCAAYVEGSLPGGWIGIENHLSYLYKKDGEMSEEEARGLAAFLATKVVDDYFRSVSGSTQVNIGDLRRLPVPSLEKIVSMGKRLGPNPGLDEIEEAFDQEFRLRG